MHTIDADHDPFHKNGEGFENRGVVNGIKTWSARDIAGMFGYDSYETFDREVLKRAIGICRMLRVPVSENFLQLTIDAGDVAFGDCKLSRFGCYLTALSADPHKPDVAKGRAYFSNLAWAAQQYMLLVRPGEQETLVPAVAECLFRISSAARHLRCFEHTVCRAVYNMDVAFFQNRGYFGVYNRGLSDFAPHDEAGANA
jgi:DNA-damage-inducible protein D